MNRNATEMERAVARTLRDSLEKLQRTAEEVNQAVGDLTSACSSARPSNSLPHLLRAQTAAASLASSLDILARFITSTMHSGWNIPSAPQEAYAEPAMEPAPQAEQFAPAQIEAAPAQESAPVQEVAAAPEIAPAPENAPVQEVAPPVPTVAAVPVEPSNAYEIPVSYEESLPEPAAAAVEETLRTVASESEAFDQFVAPEPVSPVAPAVEPDPTPQPVRPVFDVLSLPADEQELHRRANRVAKVSMQDIKMLRPGEVQLGKENHDLCLRLRDDIERAHKEYERRFHGILDHPVDYFYAWMVEILGEGDPRTLGEYPYPSAVARR